MKKIILALILIFTIGSTFYLIRGILLKSKEKELIKENLNFEYSSLTNEKIEFTNYYNKEILFIYFDSGCLYCQIKAEEIFKNINLLKDYIIYFISDEDIDKIKRFSTFFKLNSYNNIHFIQDYKEDFKNKFHIESVPFILVYKENELIQFKGSYKINFIINELNK